MSDLNTHAVRRFAGHETFAPRFGWLRKAYTAVANGMPAGSTKTETTEAEFSDAFLRPGASVELGVGKNMVNAIRYWAQVFKLTEEQRTDPKSRALFARPTTRAKWLLADTGVDPWLERPASLWLLHWWLLEPQSLAPTWWIAFNHHASPRFREEDLVAEIEAAILQAGWEPVNRSSIAKDVDCLTKMYAPRRTSSGSPGSIEDLLDSPFRELGLLEAVPHEPKTWRFVDAPRMPVPSEVVGYACLRYAAHHDLTGHVSTARLAYEPGGVGRALRLTEPALVEHLERLASTTSTLEITNTLGQRHLAMHGDPTVIANELLAAHYGSDTGPDPTAAPSTSDRRLAPKSDAEADPDPDAEIGAGTESNPKKRRASASPRRDKPAASTGAKTAKKAASRTRTAAGTNRRAVSSEVGT